MPTVTSGNITLIDLTDTKKVDIHISSNHPTIQIYNPNDSQKSFTPDWSNVPLVLEAKVYADSMPITDEIGNNFKWSRKIGDTVEPLSSTTNTVTILENELNSSAMVQYICSIIYNKESYENIITFARTDVGKDGASGNSAPAVKAQYSEDGNSGWTSELDTSNHKFIRLSYDNGATWPSLFKIAGEDGKSVELKGVAYAKTTPVTGQTISLYSDANTISQITSATEGDSYLVDGYLCVYNGTNFVCTGQIQGPQGAKGDSYYLFIRYANNVSGSGISTSPDGKSYIGFYRSSVNQVPTDVSAATWNWAKFVGEDAKSIVLTGNAQAFKVDKSNAILPKTIEVTAQVENTSITSWTYSIDGGQFTSTVPTGVARNGNVVTLTGANITSNSISIKASDGTRNDIFTVYKISDGSDGKVGPDGKPAPIAFLTNENITFAANANGQVVGTTVYCNVVAYSGTTQVAPTVGTILSTDLPTGMSIGTITTTSNQVQIPIVIANNATLGSAQNVNGVINIPVTSPVSTTLQLTWSKINSGKKGDKGDTGVGIKSTTVSYGVSDSASTRPTDAEWQSTIPVVAEGKYLWTRTIIDYTDDTIPDTVTYTYVKQGIKGDTGSSGSSVTVNSIQYQEGASATTTPTGTWSNSVVAVGEGKYLWTKTAFSDGKTAYGVAKQGISGKDGVGISSTTVDYGVSDSATVKPTTWQQDIPVVAEGKYLWTRTIIDYTDTSKADTVTYVYAKQGTKGETGTAGTSVTVKSIKYQSGTSATTAPTGTWSDSVVSVAEGNYLWTQTTFSDNKVAYGVAKQGQKGDKGDQGRGISKITEYYLATTASSGITTSTSGWTTTIQSVTSTNKYLWNYEVITYTDGATSPTTPVIIGVFGNTGATGKGIKSVTEYYLAATSSSGIVTTTPGWTTTIQTLTATNKYLWNYELITYTDNTTTTINPVIIGVYGDKGDQGIQGPKGNDAYTLILTNESHIFAGDISNAIAGTAETQILAYNGSTAQSVTIVSVNGKTAATTDSDTGIAGLKFKCSALSGASPKITFTCTTSFVSKSGSIPIVLSVGGVQFTKMFTYSIAFKGSTGAQGGAGTPASLVSITPSAHYFKSTTGKDGTFTPDYIYLYPRFQTVTYSKWEYSINGGTTWIAASGANGLSIGTYNSVANTLRIAKTSTLYTDTVTSISFRCVSSNASVYDTVSIAKIYDVVDLQIGGTNLIKNGDFSHGFNYYWNNVGTTYTIETDATYGTYLSFSSDVAGNLNNRIHTQTDHNFSHESNVTYTISFYAKSPSSGAILQTNVSGGNIPFDHILTTNWKRYTATYTTNTSGSLTMWSQKPNETIHVTKIKLEKGNKATDWSPAPEDLNNITFQIYAPNGYLLTNEMQSLTLQTFSYDGSMEIKSGVTFQWSQLIDNTWTAISGATGTTLTVTRTDVLRAKSYRCVMTYKSKEYISTITVQDKTDAYNSIMCLSSNAKGNECYWVLYTLVYSDTGEVDPLLGPVSINAPTSPVNGDYWYAVDTTNATVQLKKYNGTNWTNSTDKQTLTYLWNIVNDGSSKTPIGGNSKVQVISCHDFTATATVLCDVSNEVDGVITQSSLSITDASDPIVSTTAPTNAVDGQIWIKPNDNGAYNMFIWSQSNQNWIPSDMDTQNKVYTTKPSSYNKGDIWITESDTIHSKYKEGTLLQASKDNTTYSESDWSATLKYDKDISKMQDTLYQLSQYVTITSLGLKISAVSNSGELSPFTSLFTSTELAFYQDSEKLLTLANNQLIAPRIVVEKDLEVQGTISLGGLQLAKETNGSFSFTVTI